MIEEMAAALGLPRLVANYPDRADSEDFFDDGPADNDDGPADNDDDESVEFSDGLFDDSHDDDDDDFDMKISTPVPVVAPTDNDDDESVEISDGLYYDSHDDDDDDSYIQISAPVPVVAPAPGPVEALKRKRTVPLRFKYNIPDFVRTKRRPC